VSNYTLDWTVITSGKYFGWLLSGFYTTVQLSVISITAAFFLGIVIAVMRMSRVSPIRWLAIGYLEFFRNTPLLVQIFFWYFGAYQILPQQVNDWLGKTDFEFTAAVIALTIYTSAFIAEDIRSGVRSIPKEQMEAARSFGFSYIGAMRYVILPQAIRIIVPPLINQFLNLTKNSSLAMTIGVAELTYQARQVESYTLRPYEPFLAATLVYLCISLAITGFVTLCNKKLITS
jgi:polar amino acid transport system permease protein